MPQMEEEGKTDVLVFYNKPYKRFGYTTYMLEASKKRVETSE